MPPRSWSLLPLAAALLVTFFAPAAAQSQTQQTPPQCVPPKQLGVVFVIDDSGSMGTSDRQRLRSAAAGVGLREMGPGRVGAAVVFGADATTIFGPTVLGVNVPTLEAQIEARLQARGGTDFDAAFSAAAQQLAAMPASVDKKAIVFLSDGDASGSYTQDQQFGPQGIPIVTIGFGGSPSDDLLRIASRSGGIYSHVATVGEVQGAMARSIGFLNCVTIDAPEVVDMAPGQVRDIPFEVDAGTSAFSALASWGADHAVVARLLRPDGSEMGPGAVLPGETFDEEPSFTRATAVSPARGRWRVRLIAQSSNPESVRVSVDLLGDGKTRLDKPLEGRPNPAGPGCETEIRAAGRLAWSRCFTRITGGWRSELPVRLAGLDLDPDPGERISIFRDGRLDANDTELSVFSRGSLLPNGRLVLAKGDFDLNLQRTRLLPLTGTSESERRIGGLPIKRTAGVELGWTATGATLKASLSLGGDFASLINPDAVGASGDVVSGSRGNTLKRGFGLEVQLSTSMTEGLVVDRIGGRIDAGKIFGALAVENLFLTYEPQTGRWVGGAQINPFRASLSRYGLPSLRAKVGLSTNPIAFDEFAIEVSNINKPIGPWIFLQSIGGGIASVPPSSFAISGTVGVSAGPKVKIPGIGELTAIELNGAAKYTSPYELEASGAMKVLGQGVADAKAEVNLGNATGTFSGDLNLDFAGNGLSGRMEGFLRGGSFQFYGRVGLKIAGSSAGGGEGFVGSRGAGACRRGWGPDFGWSLDWDDGFPGGLNVMAGACDFGDLLIPSQRRQAGGALLVPVGAGSPGEMFEVRGAAGHPDIGISSPSGRSYVFHANQAYIETPGLIAIRDLANRRVFVVLNRPEEGQWRVAPFPGTTPLLPVGKARALPKPELKTSLERVSRGRLRLRFRARDIPGQKIRFVEHGPGGLVRRIRTTDDARGSIVFRPAVGRAGVRTIDAIVLQGDRQRGQIQAGRFRTSTRRPRRPASVRTYRSGERNVRISWRGVKGARSYTVGLKLEDGRRIEEEVGRNRRSILLRNISRTVSATAYVRAVSRNGISSRRETDRLKRTR